MTADLQAGRLEQSCPSCGMTEAAGSYCTRCYARTSEADWRRPERSVAQRAATDRLWADRSKEIDEAAA
jgi:hypothetical protein